MALRCPAVRAGAGLGDRLAAAGALIDLLEQLARDDRFVCRHQAPDPLVARPDERSTLALVVAIPDVVAVYLGLRSIARNCDRLHVCASGISSLRLRWGGG